MEFSRVEPTLPTRLGPARRILVTGACGLVGELVVKMLAARGHKVTALDRVYSARVAEVPGVVFVQASVLDIDEIDEACRGQDIVIHGAAIVIMGLHSKADWERIAKVNIQGTRQVLDSAKRARVRAVVQTSSVSAIISGKRHLHNVAEADVDYPDTFLDHYARTKSLSERLVLDANSDDLRTCAIRPAPIVGERAPLILRIANNEPLTVGTGQLPMDWVVVDNVAQALVLAAERILLPDSAIPGNAYFITNDEPMSYHELVQTHLRHAGHRWVWPRLRPMCLFKLLVLLVQYFYVLFGGPKEIGNLSQGLFGYMEIEQTYSCAKARQDLGYEPSLFPIWPTIKAAGLRAGELRRKYGHVTLRHVLDYDLAE